MKTNAILVGALIIVSAALAIVSYRYIAIKKYTSVLITEKAEIISLLNTARSTITRLEQDKENSDAKSYYANQRDAGMSSHATIKQTGSLYSGDAMETTIDGEFNGWDGETIFKMSNGTIWQQASYDYEYHYAYMPEVIIFKKAGAFQMKVEDVDDMIEVRQIK